MSANIWEQFDRLNDKTHTYIGKIRGVVSSGFVVDILGGASMIASGVGFSIGDSVFIENNQIIGKAPDLPIIEIIVY